MNKELFHRFLKRDILKAVKEKCGAWAEKVIIQFDGAGAHGVGHAYEPKEIVALNRWGKHVQITQADGTKRAFPIEFRKQPAQSPDLNVLDLGAWRSLQAAVDAIVYKKDLDRDDVTDRIMANCNKAWHETWAASEKLGSLFDYLEYIWEEVIRERGGNSYTLPHRANALSEKIAEAHKTNLNKVEGKEITYLILNEEETFEKKKPGAKSKPKRKKKGTKMDEINSQLPEGYSLHDKVEEAIVEDEGEKDEEEEFDWRTARFNCSCGKGAPKKGRAVIGPCDECGTWQHLTCEYPRKELQPKDGEAHLCKECKEFEKDNAEWRRTVEEREERAEKRRRLH